MRRAKSSARTADVIVIGGGLIGCSIALRLAQAKLKVTVLDRGEPGAEASSAAAGMLAPQGEMAAPNAFFDFCAASHSLYPRFVAEIEEWSGESVGYRRDGTLLVALDEEGCREFEKIYEVQTRLGLPIARQSGPSLHQLVPELSPAIRCGLLVPGDHWVDNERLTQAVIAAARRAGVTFCAGRNVTRLNVRSGRVESVEASPGAVGAGSTYSAGRYIIAAGCWSGELLKPLGIRLPLEPCRGQMLEFDSPSDLALVVRSGMHYLVPREPKRVLAGTTAEYAGYEKAVTGEGLRSILEGVTRIAPGVGKLRFRRAWAGLRPDTPDHLPILGYGEFENLIFATGHFRNGILLAPLTAQLISELLLTGSTSGPIDAYRPTRFTT